MNDEAKENITDTEERTHAHSVTVEPLVIRHGSLFSGIGGFDLAAQWAGWENVFQVEINKYCTRVLEKNFPNAKRYGDIREFDGTQYRGTIDVVSGGFPCQPFSVAGKRKGKEDDRHLWPEMLRVLSEIKPTWIVGENVPGIIKMELDNVLDDLERIGYEAQTFIIPAASVDARHRRERIWIVAWNTNSGNRNKGKVKKMEEKQNTKSARIRTTLSNTTSKVDGCDYSKSIDRQVQQLGKCVGKGNVPDTKRINDISRRHGTSSVFGETGWNASKIQRVCRWPTEPRVGRVANGVPNRMDRLKGLGNAIVPQVALEIFLGITAVTV